MGEEDNSGIYIDALKEIVERIAELNVPKLERSLIKILHGTHGLIGSEHNFIAGQSSLD